MLHNFYDYWATGLKFYILKENLKKCVHASLLKMKKELQLQIELFLNFLNPDDPELCKRGICWENSVGAQYFKLTLLDFIVQLVLMVVDLAR